MFYISNHILAIYYRIKGLVWFKIFLNEFDCTSVLLGKIKMNNPHCISIGTKVYIHEYSWLYCINDDSKLYIDDRTQIGHFFHLVCFKGIKIGKDVLIADKVFISDCSHSYSDVSKPIMSQEIRFINNVHIGDNSWIGDNVTIIGCSIGKNCVVGANSFVNRNVDDYTVVAGNPAKVIKKYDFKLGKWVRIDG